MFPFAKFPEADPILGPEMKSTGEVMGTGRIVRRGVCEGAARVRRRAADARRVSASACAIATSRRRSTLARRLVAQGFEIVATAGTAKAHQRRGHRRAARANKVREGRPHIVDMIKNDEISLIVNTTEGKQAIFESRSIRREAVHKRVTYYTTVAAGLATCDAHRAHERSRREPAAGSAPGQIGR